MEAWWGEEEEGKRTAVPIGWDTVRGLQEEHDGVGVSFRMTDTGRPEEKAPIVWETLEEDQADGRRVAGGQGMVPGSGTGVPGTGQGERGQGIVSRGSGDERLEGKGRQ